MRRCFILKLLLFCSILFGNATLLHSQNKTEYEVKALYLVSLLKYIQFPDNGNNFIIGVVGDNPFKGHLQKYHGQPLNGRKIQIVFFKNNIDQAVKANCHFVFISKSEILQQKGHIQKLNKAASVIFGDNNLFMKSGGLINFQFLGNKVRWESNKNLLDRKKLKIDFQIYKLSTNKGQVQ